ncbi:MAG: DNA mismatch repair endonuclease MutL [Clostridiales bacterium]|nr:DNA mismatch repair endonuclease MutL [Clostridiales bacterium]
MANIKILDQDTINQIAAGEVVERPASVVKELLENAIDAKATAVTVEIKEGGISFIRITDNGCGIEKDDISLAFLRYSTSKIKSALDLLTVSSLGFRGEALSSIAAVGMVELITKTKNSLSGVRYTIEGGIEKSCEDIGVPDGTTFIIRNLFFNTPARRKFLKTPTTEAGYISDIVERIALSHPEVSIRFICNNKSKLHTSGNGSLKDVIYTIYGREITRNLIEVNESCDFMTLTGFIGKPVISRGNRNYESYFINGRYIKSSLISRGIEDAYKSFMMQHKYPFTCLNVKINQDLLDVNVHPAKMELRFTNQEEIYPFIFKSLDKMLHNREMITEANIENTKKNKEDKVQIASKNRPPEPFEKTRLAEGKELATKEETTPLKEILREKPNYSSNVEKPLIPSVEPNSVVETKVEESLSITTRSATAIQDTINNKEKTLNDEPYPAPQLQKIQQAQTSQQMTLFDDKLLSEKARQKHILVGQVFNTYWIIEYGDKMFIIDQHAAHEKVLYERLVARYNKKEPLSQEILPPIVLSLTMREEEMLKNNIKMFEDLGFEIESMGGSDYAVRAVPYDCLSISDKDLLMELVDGLTGDFGLKVNNELLLEKMATMSCKAAVKGNNKLSEREANELIDELLTLENPYNCPHGRPTIISMTKYELEKKFKRVL